MWVVLDDQQDAVAGLEVEPVVGQLLDDAFGRRRCWLERRWLVVLLLRRDARRERRAGIFQRQIEREGRALAGRAAQMNLAAEQARELAADREAKAGAAVFAAGTGVR